MYFALEISHSLHLQITDCVQIQVILIITIQFVPIVFFRVKENNFCSLRHQHNVTIFVILTDSHNGTWSESLCGSLGPNRGIHNNHGASHLIHDSHGARKPDGHLSCSFRSKQKPPQSIYTSSCQPCCHRSYCRCLSRAFVHKYTLPRGPGFVN